MKVSYFQHKRSFIHTLDFPCLYNKMHAPMHTECGVYCSHAVLMISTFKIKAALSRSTREIIIASYNDDEFFSLTFLNVVTLFIRRLRNACVNGLVMCCGVTLLIVPGSWSHNVLVNSTTKWAWFLQYYSLSWMCSSYNTHIYKKGFTLKHLML